MSNPEKTLADLLVESLGMLPPVQFHADNQALASAAGTLDVSPANNIVGQSSAIHAEHVLHDYLCNIITVIESQARQVDHVVASPTYPVLVYLYYEDKVSDGVAFLCAPLHGKDFEPTVFGLIRQAADIAIRTDQYTILHRGISLSDLADPITAAMVDHVDLGLANQPGAVIEVAEHKDLFSQEIYTNFFRMLAPVRFDPRPKGLINIYI